MKIIARIVPLLLLLACGTPKSPTYNNPYEPGPKTVSIDDIYKPYSYAATVVDIYDGDTFTVEFEIGFGLTFEDVIRLARVDTPELRGGEREEGKKVRDYVEKLIMNKRLIAVTDKDDRGKYGRLISEIYFYKDESWINLSDHLIEKGMAEHYE